LGQDRRGEAVPREYAQGIPCEPGLRLHGLIRIAVPAHVDGLRLQVAQLTGQPSGQVVVPLDIVGPAVVLPNEGVAVAALMTAALVRVELIPVEVETARFEDRPRRV